MKKHKEGGTLTAGRYLTPLHLISIVTVRRCETLSPHDGGA